MTDNCRAAVAASAIASAATCHPIRGGGNLSNVTLTKHIGSCKPIKHIFGHKYQQALPTELWAARNAKSRVVVRLTPVLKKVARRSSKELKSWKLGTFWYVLNELIT